MVVSMTFLLSFTDLIYYSAFFITCHYPIRVATKSSMG